MRYYHLVLALVLTGCGGAAEPEPPGITVTRLMLPDSSQAPFEVTVQGETLACAQLDCELELELPVAVQQLHVLDALGNEFEFAIVDLAPGPHVVSEPLAPDAGVFLPYTLEYTVVH